MCQILFFLFLFAKKTPKSLWWLLPCSSVQSAVFSLLHICRVKSWTKVVHCSVKEHTCFIRCVYIKKWNENWGFDVRSSIQALYCKYLNISIDIPSLPHQRRCSAQRGDQRLAVHRAPLEIWCRLTAPLLLFKLCDAVNYLFFFCCCFKLKGLFCEYDPLCDTSVTVITFFPSFFYDSCVIMSEICMHLFYLFFLRDLALWHIHHTPYVNWRRRLCVFAIRMRS